MNMRTKVALFVMALRDKFPHNREEFYSRLCEGIPWILLPDAIIEYIDYYQPSYFVELVDGTDISWLKFPSGEILAEVTANNAKEIVEYYLADSKECGVCKGTCLDEFDKKNYGHAHFHELRISILQEMIFDKILCEKLLDENKSYEDHFVVRHNQNCLNSFQLQEQMERFEELGFLYLVGKVYEKTGLLLNQEWFEKNVHQVLYADYSKDLAERTYSSMQISPEIEGRINDLNFELSEDDKQKIKITDNLEQTFDEMYAIAFKLTWSEI